jgi:hypothetical protein
MLQNKARVVVVIIVIALAGLITYFGILSVSLQP